MSYLKNFMVVGCFAAMVVSFQGCDQIQKFTDYLSPNRKPAEVVEQTQPAAVEPQAEVVQPAAVVPEAPVAAPQVAETKEAAPLPANVLAKIGTWSITIDEFNTQLKSLEQAGLEGFDINNIEQKQYVLGQLLQQQMLVQAALKQKMEQSKEVVDAINAFRDTLLAQAFVEKASKDIVVTDQETEEFYNENRADLADPTRWHVREIVVDSEEKAKTVLVDLGQGIAFEDIAKERSIGATAAQGGDLGMIETFENEKMGQIVAALDVGANSGIFEGPQGFYIVNLVAKEGGEIPALAEIKDDLKNYVLMLKQQQAVFEALAQVQEQMEINVNEKLLEE